MDRCPQCQMEVKPGARKCPHCQSYLDAELAAQRRQEQAPPSGPAGGDPTQSGVSFIVQGVIELLFAASTLLLGWIVGALTVLFSIHFAVKSFRYAASRQEGSGAAVAGGVMCVIAAIAAGILTWLELEQNS